MPNIIDFQPSEELKKLQLIELDLFKRFKQVCQKYNLKYFAAGGTMLGAARHKGFIPWDDDIDIQMYWEDYKILEKVAPKEFKYPYVFQNYKTDIYFDITPTARIRNSETTGCTKWEYDNVRCSTYNRGIFIDIFILFPIPDSMEERKIQKEKIEWAWRAIRGWYAYIAQQNKTFSVYDKYLDDWENASKKFSIEQLKQLYYNYCDIKDSTTKEIGQTSFRTHNPHFMWKREWFEETTELPFEDTTISCPKNYNDFLKKQFGDWRTPVFNGAMHEMYIYDTDIPYYKNLKLSVE